MALKGFLRFLAICITPLFDSHFIFSITPPSSLSLHAEIEDGRINKRVWSPQESDCDSSFLDLNLENAIKGLNQGVYQITLDSLNALLDAHEICFRSNQSLLINALNIKADLLLRLGQFRACISLTRQISRISDNHSDDLSLAEIRTLMLRASGHHRLYETDTAIAINSKVFGTLERQFPGSELRISVLNNLANCYRDIKKYDRAIHALEQCLQLSVEKFGLGHYGQADYHYNLALNHSDKKEYAKALEHHKISSKITRKQNKWHPYLIEDYQKIAESQILLNRDSIAELHLDTALQIAQHVPDSYEQTSEVYAALAKLQNKLNRAQLAVTYQRRALQDAITAFGSSDPRVGRKTSDLAHYLAILGEREDAQKTLMKSFAVMEYNPKNFNPRAVEGRDNLYGVISSAVALYLHNYKTVGLRSDLDSAYLHFQNASALLILIKSMIDDPKTRYTINNKVIPFFEAGIEINYFLFKESDSLKYVENAFKLSERSRKSTVLEAILGQHHGELPGIPNRIVEREKSLSSKINDIQFDLAYEKNMTTHRKDSLSLALIQIQTEYYALTDSLRKFHASFFHYRHYDSLPSVKKIQDKIKPNQLILEYFDGSDYIYLFKVSKNDISLTTIPRYNQLETTISRWLSATQGKTPIDLFHQTYQEWGRKIFAALMPDLDLRAYEELVIIPDGLEANLPFEVLLTDTSTSMQFADLPYLLNDVSVSYIRNLYTWYLPTARSNRKASTK